MNINPLNRKERDRQLRRADIMKAAEQVFAAQGYLKATIKDIACQAQYATGTVYLYFKDKEELYRALLDNKTCLLLSMARDKTENIISVQDKLKIFTETTFKFFEQNHDFGRIFLLESDNSIEEKRFFSSPQGKAFHDFLVSLIRKAQEEKVARTDINPEQLAVIFREVVKAITLHWLEFPQIYHNDSRTAAALAVDIFFQGAFKR